MRWEDLQQDLMKNSHVQMQFITIHKEMSLKSVLTHKGFVSQLAPDEEIQQLLEEIWGEAHDEELQRELTEAEKTLPHCGPSRSNTLKTASGDTGQTEWR